jgi:hypothetical protein
MPSGCLLRKTWSIGNRQLETENLFEWLADPGCFPQIPESNADLETLARSSFETGMKSTGCCWPFSNHSASG